MPILVDYLNSVFLSPPVDQFQYLHILTRFFKFIRPHFSDMAPVRCATRVNIKASPYFTFFLLLLETSQQHLKTGQIM